VVKTLTYLATSNRVQTEVRPGATRTFAYDGAGNIVQDNQGGGAPTHGLVYNDAGRLMRIDVNATPTTGKTVTAQCVVSRFGRNGKRRHWETATMTKQ
jgi:YD repeat-containing protein